MGGRTTYNVSRPGFIIDPGSADRALGNQIDWDRVPAAYLDAGLNKKVLQAGTIVARTGTGKVVPRAGAPADSQSITGITETGGVATATKNAHGYAVGDQVTISGATGGNAAAYNTTHTIASVPTANTFTFAVAGGTGAATGTLSAVLKAYGILLTTAVQDERFAALSGYGVILGGVLYKNLLPDKDDGDFETFLAELKAVGTGYVFRTYADSRSS